MIWITTCLFALLMTVNIYQELPPDLPDSGKYLHTGGISYVSWSPDGSKLAVSVWPQLIIYDGETLEAIVRIDDVPNHDMAWHPEGDLIATVVGGSSDTDIWIWDASTGGLVKQLKRTRDLGQRYINMLVWSPDGNYLLTNNDIGTEPLLLHWNWLAEEDPIAVYEPGFPFEVFSIEFNQDGSLVYVHGIQNRDSHLVMVPYTYILDTTTFSEIDTGIHQFFGASWSPDGNAIVGLFDESIVGLWSISEASFLNFKLASLEVGSLKLDWHGSKNYIAILHQAHSDGSATLSVWQPDSNYQYDRDVSFLVDSHISSLDWRPGTDQLAIGGENGVWIDEFTCPDETVND